MPSCVVRERTYAPTTYQVLSDLHREHAANEQAAAYCCLRAPWRMLRIMHRHACLAHKNTQHKVTDPRPSCLKLLPGGSSSSTSLGVPGYQPCSLTRDATTSQDANP